MWKFVTDSPEYGCGEAEPHTIRHSQRERDHESVEASDAQQPAFHGSEHLFRADGVSATYTLLCITAEEPQVLQGGHPPTFLCVLSSEM